MPEKISLPQVLIIIPTWNHLETTTKPCLESVLECSGGRCRIVCVDNASKDGTQAYLAEMAGRDRRVTWIDAKENLGWAGGSLLGLCELKEDDSHFCLLNSDTIVTPGWLEKMLALLEKHPGLSMVIPNERPSPAGTPGVESSTPSRFTLEQRGPGPPPRSTILRLARDVERRHAGESRPCAPSGFCVLVDARHCGSVKDYLAAFDRFQSGELDWQRYLSERGLTCRVALDTCVFHARGGSGGYDGYRR